MSLGAAKRRVVEARARSRREYCGLHQDTQHAILHVEHIWPRTLGGNSSLGNLALSCASCNLAKHDRVQASDPQTRRVVPLFNPRQDVWWDHFAWDGRRLRGRTDVRWATIAALKMNHPRQTLAFLAESLLGLFPPDES